MGFFFFGTFNITSEKQKEHFWKHHTFQGKKKSRRGRILKLNRQQAATTALQFLFAEQYFH